MKDHFGLPGIGGSLGECAVCGKPFLKEILLGDKVFTFTVAGCNQELAAHAKCKAILKRVKTFAELPEESPLRQAWGRLQPRE